MSAEPSPKNPLFLLFNCLLFPSLAQRHPPPPLNGIF